MRVESTRFGHLEVDTKDIVTFKEGPLGFENLEKFFIVDPGDQTLILWMQSIENKSVAFPIIEPKIFRPDYSISLMSSEMAALELETLAEASIYTIITIPQVVTEMSANLKAPIVINNKTKRARQIVLQDNKLEVRSLMYKELKKYIISFRSSDDSKRTQVGIMENSTAPSKSEVTETNPHLAKNVPNRIGQQT